MRQLAPHLTLDSAGTGGWHVGDPPYAPMQDAARMRGVALADIRARQFSIADFAAFDLIVAMDRQNLSDIEAMRPEGNDTPVRLLAAKDLPDPYYTRDFDATLDMIEMSCASLLTDIAALPPR